MSSNLVRMAPAALQRTEALDALTVAKMLAQSGYFGDVKEAGQALAKILAGQELGMAPIASLMGVYYQQGKVTYSANIMAAAIKKSGQYTYEIRAHDDKRCEIEFFHRSTGPGVSSWTSLGVSSFTLDDAKRGGLLDGPNKHNWTKWPRNMVFARAMSNGAKWFCPDVFGGVTPYTPDELGAEVVVSDDGSVGLAASNGHARPAIAGDVVPPTRSKKREQLERRWAELIAEARDAGVDDVEPIASWVKADLARYSDEQILEAGAPFKAAIVEAVQAKQRAEAALATAF